VRFPTLAAWLAWQETGYPLQVDLGLERIAAVHGRLGLARPPVVLTIGGTNGKGSVVATIEAMLLAGGYETGLFTSPHLRRYNERIRVRGRAVDDRLLVEAFARIDAARGDLALTFFEWNTLAALVCFAWERVEVAVLEVGLGGRLDAVNVLDADVAAVVSVGLDHQEWLGHSLDEIGAEKAGVFRRDRPAIFGARSLSPGLLRAADARGARLRRLGVDFDFVERPDGWDYVGLGSRRRELPLPTLAGAHQLGNAATALAVLEAVEPTLLVPDAAVRAGLTGVRLAGRFQCLRAHDRDWILDVAHNPDAAQALTASLAARPVAGRTLAVCGILADKDMDGIVAAVAPQVQDWTVVTPDSPRARAAGELAARVAARCPGAAVGVAASVSAGCMRALSRAMGSDRILVFGSFHTVGPALDWLGCAPRV
jgi:dihydrofolate synthase/folylpolyglutamate synthase